VTSAEPGRRSEEHDENSMAMQRREEKENEERTKEYCHKGVFGGFD